jgi:1,4-alpha-glucan branching enzyme
MMRTKGGEFCPLAEMYHQRFLRYRDLYEGYGRDIVSAFKRFQDLGKVEIITCGATHGFLPNMIINRQAMKAQIRIAVNDYKIHFGDKPEGFWLPECGYHPGIDQILKDAGIRYFFLDTHGILYASPRPRYGVFAPIYCPSGVAAFGRDVESSKQVWSSIDGYPGDYNYREFYRDIGFDLDYEYIKPYIHPDGIRINTGIKYYRITGKGNHKEPYVRAWALEKASQHAGNFMFNREKQIEYLYDFLGKKPILVSPYDAELFGHWWFEGPEWLDYLIRKIFYDQKTIRLITPSEYLRENPVNQIATPTMSSWGWKGYSEVWLEGSNDWIYRHLHKASERMIEIARTYPHAHGLKRRALNQAVRELLLAQSSDWAFIMKTGTAVEYARKRTKEHLFNFIKLYEAIKRDQIDKGFLRDLETRNNIFKDIDYMVYAD